MSCLHEEETMRSAAKKLLKILQSTSLYSAHFQSPRALGDAIEEVVRENLPACLPKNYIKQYEPNFPRRAMADAGVTDKDDNLYYIDVKTHNTETKFNMPNLTSVRRINNFYKSNKNYFVLIIVEYKIGGDKVDITNVIIAPIEHLAWECLTIGALGWGQIQIKDSSRVKIDHTQKREEWMQTLFDKLASFYQKELTKLQSRKQFAVKSLQEWKSKK